MSNEMEVSAEIIDAIFQAESVLADYSVAVKKGYVSAARKAVFKAADEIRAFQNQAESIYIYTPDMPRPNCPDCGCPVEQLDEPKTPWKGVCTGGHVHTYQLDIEEETEGL